MTEELKKLCDKFDFIIETENVLGIVLDKFKFIDGREYHLQHPSFMELHRFMMGAETIDHVIFEYGLKKLIPKNDKSPVINEEYLAKHRVEGFNLWSKLIRECLLRDSLE